MLESIEYHPDELLTFDSFLIAMAGFPLRHPVITSMEQDLHDCPDNFDYCFIGFIDHTSEFTISYNPADGVQNSVEAVCMGIVLKTTLRQIDKKELTRQTEQLNHNFPETGILSLYSILTEVGYKHVLGTELILKHDHIVGEIDLLFDILVRTAPKAHRMFCLPPQPVGINRNGHC